MYLQNATFLGWKEKGSFRVVVQFFSQLTSGAYQQNMKTEKQQAKPKSKPEVLLSGCCSRAFGK